MRKDFGSVFPASGRLPDLHPRLEEMGYKYRLDLSQYIRQASDRYPGDGLPEEEGLCEVRAYTGPGLEPILMLVYARKEGVPEGCLLSAIKSSTTSAAAKVSP